MLVLLMPLEVRRSLMPPPGVSTAGENVLALCGSARSRDCGGPPLGVAAPRCVVRLGATGHLRDAAAVRVHDVDLVLAGAIADEGDLLSVRRPGVEAVVDLSAAAVGELDAGAPVWAHGEDVRGNAGAVADPWAGEGDP